MNKIGFFELKLSEKIGAVFSNAVKDKKYDPYEFAEKWCLSETCRAVFDFDETLVSQARSYILRVFESEISGSLPTTNEKDPLYSDDVYWFGYLITYWHFLEGITGEEIHARYNIRKMLDEYGVLHTLSVKAAIEKIKEDYRKS